MEGMLVCPGCNAHVEPSDMKDAFVKIELGSRHFANSITLFFCSGCGPRILGCSMEGLTDGLEQTLRSIIKNPDDHAR